MAGYRVLLQAAAVTLHPDHAARKEGEQPYRQGRRQVPKARAAERAAQPSVGAQDRTRPRPNSATVTPSTAHAKKRPRGAGASPRVPTDSQNIAGVLGLSSGLSWGETRIRSTPRKLFDGPITVHFLEARPLLGDTVVPLHVSGKLLENWARGSNVKLLKR